MTHPLRKGLAGAVIADAVLPSSALAASGHDQHGARGATSRVNTTVKRVHRVLDRALEAADDGDDTVAITRLGKVDARLAKALKAVERAADRNTSHPADPTASPTPVADRAPDRGADRAGRRAAGARGRRAAPRRPRPPPRAGRRDAAGNRRTGPARAVRCGLPWDSRIRCSPQ